jgi:hypothetical protein
MTRAEVLAAHAAQDLQILGVELLVEAVFHAVEHAGRVDAQLSRSGTGRTSACYRRSTRARRRTFGHRSRGDLRRAPAGTPGARRTRFRSGISSMTAWAMSHARDDAIDESGHEKAPRPVLAANWRLFRRRERCAARMGKSGAAGRAAAPRPALRRAGPRRRSCCRRRRSARCRSACCRPRSCRPCRWRRSRAGRRPRWPGPR